MLIGYSNYLRWNFFSSVWLSRFCVMFTGQRNQFSFRSRSNIRSSLCMRVNSIHSGANRALSGEDEKKFLCDPAIFPWINLPRSMRKCTFSSCIQISFALHVYGSMDQMETWREQTAVDGIEMVQVSTCGKMQGKMVLAGTDKKDWWNCYKKKWNFKSNF